MDSLTFETHYKPHLKSRIASGSLVLFTGAGFSLEAVSQTGELLPTTAQLTKLIWQLCYPNDEFEVDTELQDIYAHALARHSNRLNKLLMSRFMVDQARSPDWYKTVMSVPWFRAYTLNIDNLMEEAGHVCASQRRIKPISANSENVLGLSNVNLDVIHLNGMLDDAPSNVTFSRLQYAERIGTCPYYKQLSSDLITRPVVFIGSSLDEGSLWEHIVSRGEKGTRLASELRPRSYLVLPSLNKSKQEMLAKFNINWLPMTGKQFVEEVLMTMSEVFSDGFKTLESRGSISNNSYENIKLVSDLAQVDPGHTEYLMGHEPTWMDIQKGKAAERECFDFIWNSITKIRASVSLRQFIVITGTAGSGKSTAMMWTGLKLISEGLTVGWMGAEYKFGRKDFSYAIKNMSQMDALLINDADIYLGQLSSMIREVIDKYPRMIILVEARSSKVDNLIKPYELNGLTPCEITMPYLSDSDIDRIIYVLDAENRLGRLKGMTAIQRVHEFKRRANRHLLVAMYEATSGNKFSEMAEDELSGLDSGSKLAYALVSTATAYRFSLTRDEVIIACGDSSNETLNNINTLVRRKLINVSKNDGDFLKARHRVIANMIYDALVKSGEFERVLRGLLLIGVAKVHSLSSRTSRSARLLRTFINHNFMNRAVDAEVARNIYAEFEAALEWDSHYWLHRGALELTMGELGLAENFLNQALSINGDDIYIQTEWAYLLFKKAISEPYDLSSKDYIREAIEILEAVIIKRKDQSAHAYHVLGQQGLNWVAANRSDREEKRTFLLEISSKIKTAVQLHPRDALLERLEEDIKKQILMLAVSG